MNTTKITASIRCPGCPGVSDGFIDVEFGLWASYDEFFCVFGEEMDPVDGRSSHRAGLLEWANKWHENMGPCELIYGDECPDCRQPGLFDVQMSQGDSRKQCPNKNCISNQPEDER